MDHRFSRKSTVLFFVCLYLCLFVLSFLTPMVSDDYSYCFAWGDNARITRFAQIPPSMAIHRALTNGRVLAHGLVQLLLIRPKLIFDLLNAGNAVLLLWLFSRYLQDRRHLAVLLAAALMLWTFTPSFGEVSLWLTGSVNYSWGISVFLLFLWPYAADWLELARRPSLPRDLLALPLAFAAGAWSENGSVAVLFIALCLTVLTALREKKLRWQALAGLLLGCLGFVFLMSAPATTGRAAVRSMADVLGNFGNIALQTLRRLWLLYLLYAVFLLLAIRRGADRKRLILSAILVLGGLGSLSAFSFALYFTGRHFCFTVFVTVLAVMILLEQLADMRDLLPKLLLTAAALLFIWRLAFGLLDIAVIYKKSLDREAVIAAALAEGQGDVGLEVYQPRSGYSVTFKLNPDPEAWPNTSVALYYGLDHVFPVYPGQ